VKIRVGFVINFKSTSWLGGYNYFKNLFLCLNENGNKKIEPVLITDNYDYELRNDKVFSKYEILNTNLVSRSNLIQKVFSKILIIIFGKNFMLDNFLKKNKIKILSHSGWIGHKSDIKNFPWLPDFQELHFPENFNIFSKLLRKMRVIFSSKFSTKILVSSKSVQQDLKKINFNAYKNSELIKHSVEIPTFNKLKPLGYLKKKYNIKSHYYFLPNHYWIHKNHLTVLKSLAINNGLQKNYQIVSTGQTFDHRHPDHFKNIKLFIKKKSIKNYQILKIVPYIDLMSLMYYSIALINPSYSEGWSNTVEQAKAMKKKTIISNIKVHKEQKNKNTILFNPIDYKKLKKILDDEYLRYLKIKKKYDKNYFNSNIKLRKNFINNYQNLLFKYL
tara:strand:- start:320 stop:1483 length:1164 start_codon:yes stop_codon:yes gene_type:complete